MSTERLFTRAFALCCLANFGQALAFNLFLHFPGFLHDLGAGEVTIGVLFGLTAVTAVVMRAPIGPLIDARGVRGLILAGGVLNTAVTLAYLGITSLGPAIYGLRILHGICEAVLFTAFMTYAIDLVPAARRTEGIALFAASGMLTIALGGLVGDALLARGGFDALFATASGWAAFSLLASLPLPDERRRRGAGRLPGRGLRAALVQRDLLPLWWIGLLFSVALAAAFAFLRRFVDETGVGSVGGFFGVYAGAAMALRILLGWVPDRVGPKRVLLPALACLALGFLLLAQAGDARDVLVAGLLCGIGHGYTFPILLGLVITRVAEGDRGSATAIFTALFDVGVAFGAPVFGGIVERTGFGVAYATAAGVILAGALSFALWDRGR